ncbi:MAG: penicillin-binding protein 2 [Epsilonproteobacteria bacterium]|nr:penicillin-binding protein 2 [Campylobacterota bacterium]
MIFLLAYIVIVVRLFNLQITKSRRLSEISSNEASKIIHEISSRKDIVDRNGILLAVSVPAYSVYAKTYNFSNIKEAAAILKIGKEEYGRIVSHYEKGRFEWIARRMVLSNDNIEKLYPIKGIHLIKTTKRIYPQNELASHIIGFCGIDGNGLEGIEKRLNSDIVIKGKTGSLIFVDAKGRRIANREVPPRKVGKITLSIDARLQAIVQKELSDAVKKFDAQGASAILMRPNGAILAASSYPEYNLNNAANVPYSIIRNRLITDVFEPGSVFKIVTVSAALDTDSVKPDELFFTHNGKFRVGRHIIHDSHPHGWLSVKNIITKSSNIGAMEIAGKVGVNKFFAYIRKFGFGRKTGIELPGESKGIVKKKILYKGEDFTTVAFGQGIAVTVLQMTKAFAIIANGGKNLYPHLLKMNKITANGQIIKYKTAMQVIKILKAVVTEGTGKEAYINGIPIAGKTGTAQVASKKGGYIGHQYIASFGGIFPADNPKAILYVVIKRPQVLFYGGSVAAPVFRNIVIASFPIINQLKGISANP